MLLAQPDNVRARMADVLRYTGVENPAAGDVARMTERSTTTRRSMRCDSR
jgi:hypothetical protein